MFLSAMVAIGAGLSARYAYKAASEAHEQAVQARRQADVARDQLTASERPWIMLTKITPVALFSDDKAGVSFSAKLSVKNVGHSPSEHIFVSGRLLIADLDPLPNQAIKEVCQKAKSGPSIMP